MRKAAPQFTIRDIQKGCGVGLVAWWPGGQLSQFEDTGCSRRRCLLAGAPSRRCASQVAADFGTHQCVPPLNHHHCQVCVPMLPGSASCVFIHFRGFEPGGGSNLENECNRSLAMRTSRRDDQELRSWPQAQEPRRPRDPASDLLTTVRQLAVTSGACHCRGPLARLICFGKSGFVCIYLGRRTREESTRPRPTTAPQPQGAVATLHISLRNTLRGYRGLKCRHCRHRTNETSSLQ